MRVLKANQEGISEASEIVSKGGVVAYPTDTVYGLGCDPLNLKAVRRLIAAKGERNKPLPILVSSLEEAKRIAYLNPQGRKLASKFWPGPLTIVLRAKRIVPQVVTAGHVGVGVRCPDHAVALALIKMCGGLLVGTSANITGTPPCVSADGVIDRLSGRLDAVLDGGRALGGIPSTVVSLLKPKLSIVRSGPIGENALQAALRGAR